MFTSWWVVITARPPRCRCPEMMPASQSTAATSSATKGSSSIHSGRFSLTRRASATRRFWPCDRYLQARSSRPARPTCSSASSASSSRDLFVGETGGSQQVFQRRQLFLDRVEVTEVAKVGAEFVGQALDRFAVPADFAGFRRQQADQHAQQAGLAGAVPALQIEQLPGFQPEAEAGEQAALAAHAFQIVSFKHQGKNRNKSAANYERASVAAD